MMQTNCLMLHLVFIKFKMKIIEFKIKYLSIIILIVFYFIITCVYNDLINSFS